VNSRDIKQPEAKLSVMCCMSQEEEVKDDPVSSSSPSRISRGQRRKQPETFKPKLFLLYNSPSPFLFVAFSKLKRKA